MELTAVFILILTQRMAEGGRMTQTCVIFT